MIKGTYFITEADREKNRRCIEVNGYLFDYEGLAFGIRKIGRIWEVTDIKTGLLCCHDILRRKDACTALTPQVINLIKKAHESTQAYIISIIKDIEKAYEKAGYYWEIVA